MTDLPNWVYDLVGELQREEYEHPVYHESGVWCPGKALLLVPDAVKANAAVIAEYRRQSDNDEQPEPGGKS